MAGRPRLVIRTRRAGAAGLLVLLVAGCGATVAGGQSTSSSGSTGNGAGDQLFGRRAQQVAAAWSGSGLLNRWHGSFVAAEPLLREPDWTPRGSLKAAFYGGWVRTQGALPDVSRKASVALRRWHHHHCHGDGGPGGIRRHGQPPLR